MKGKSSIFFILMAAFFLWACGIEDYPFIYPIPEENVRPTMSNRAVVQIPTGYEGTPFSHFAIYYRIYVSDVPLANTDPNTFSAINPTLNSNYNFFRPYIGSTTQVNVDMNRLFQNRGYNILNFEGHSISSVLSSSVWGRELIFDFSSGRDPTMTVNDNTYTLWRATGIFIPQPDRLFINSYDLTRSENLISTINADVQNKPGIAAGIPLYTYAAMYITAVGINVAAYTEIYSTPVLIHVFLLPN
jgi:hypothetical protein